MNISIMIIKNRNRIADLRSPSKLYAAMLTKASLLYNNSHNIFAIVFSIPFKNIYATVFTMVTDVRLYAMNHVRHQNAKGVIVNVNSREKFVFVLFVARAIRYTLIAGRVNEWNELNDRIIRDSSRYS